jgi:aspartate ammonia-lyase
MSTYRLEKDSLGEVMVPVDALYGAQTGRALLNFPISGLHPWPVFIRSMGLIKRAAAEVNAGLGLLPSDIAAAIVTASTEVMEGNWDSQFIVDPFQAGAGTSHHMNINEVIANRATVLSGGQLGEYRIHPNDHVNMSQSTNDVIPSAIRIGALLRLNELTEAIKGLSSALWKKAEEFDGIVKSGRTHLQDAVPIRLGQEFGAYARAVERDNDRIQTAAEGLRRLGIGGTAVGTGLNSHPEFHPCMVIRISEIAGFPLYESDNLFESMQSLADIANFSASLRTLSGTLMRIANDFRLMASGPATGLDEILLPPLQPGSSIMPGKVNPVMAEMLNMAMFHIQGCDLTISLAAQAGQLELNVMMPIIAHNLFEAMQVMIGSTKAFTEKCVAGVSANREKAEGWLDRNAILVTALNPLIGYAAGATLVKEALRNNRTIREVALEKAAAGALINRQTNLPVTATEIKAVFSNLRNLTEGGIAGVTFGG